MPVPIIRDGSVIRPLPASATSATDFSAEIQSFLQEWDAEGDTVTVQTSGSTGTPKVMQVSKDAMRFSAQRTCAFLGLQPGDSALLALPVRYISGKMMVVRALEAGLTLYAVPPSATPLETVQQSVDFCALTPLQVQNSIHQIHHFRKLIIGGAAVSPQLKDKLYQDAQLTETNRVYETYGMTETLSHIALRQIFPVEEDCFRAFPDVGLSTDGRGCLQISAPGLLTTDITTNDIVELTGSDFFRFIGRADNIINSAGLKISPEQVELEILRQTGIECIISSLPSEMLGQQVVGVVEAGQMSDAHIKTLTEMKFSNKNYAPKVWLTVHAFPRTENGKLDRRKLQTMLPYATAR